MCKEADKISTDPIYDVVIADSVFQYFQSSEYGMDVLKKMWNKAEKMIVITDLYDESMKEEHLNYRRQCVENYDEKYSDFAVDENISLLSERVLCENSNLYIVKSVSKSYGVTGLRLGILASGNIDIIKVLKQAVPIWNINSMAEFFMQILDKYKNDYKNYV